MKHIDISEEFHLFRMNNGVTLIRPEERKYLSVDYDLNHTVKSISQLHCNIFFYDLNNKFRLANDSLRISLRLFITKSSFSQNSL